MSTASVSSATGGTASTGGGDSTACSITGSQVSIVTDPYNHRVRFADSIDDEYDELSRDQQPPSTSGSHSGPSGTLLSYSHPTSLRSASSPAQTSSDQVEYEPQETVRYSPMYLCPQENFKSSLSRSSPNSPAGSNVSIVGSLVSPRKTSILSKSAGISPSCKLRTRYSKRRGQERSTDRERQPSVCSDSETDSISGAMAVEDMHLSNAQAKKWSLPLPIVTRSSESDSASSSWSARSADEATEDERSPVPSPSASTHSGDDPYNLDPHRAMGSQNQLYTPESSPKSSKAAEQETRKLAMKAKQNEEYVQTSTFQQLALGSVATAMGSTGDGAVSDISATTSKASGSKDKSKGGRKVKKISKAGESHHFQRMKATNYGRCLICDAYVYFWGMVCSQCQLICHKKCLKKMTIMCPRAPLGPRCGVLNQDIESFPDTEMVPILVLKCTAEIERRAITRPGVYRLSGVASRVEKLLKSFESGPDLIDLSDVSCNDITSLLKVYLRNLKEPLVMNHIYKEYLDIGRVFRRDEDDSVVNDGIMTGNPERSELLRQIRTVIAKLTPHRLATMRHMMAHLKRVTSYHRQNNMTPSAMGIIFAPTIFRPREKVNDLFTEVFEAAPQSRVIELLIRHYEWIFEWRPDYSDLLEEFEPIRSEPIEGTEAGSSEQMPPSPPLSPSNAMSSDSNLFSNSNMTANIGASICGGYHQKCSSTRVSAAVRHSQVRRTSSSSSASPSPGASAMGGTGPCTGHHHKKASHTMAAGAQEASQHPHHCLSSSASTFTFD